MAADVSNAAEGLAASVYVPAVQPIPLKGVAPDMAPEQAADTYLQSAMNFLVRQARVKRREGYNTPVGTTGTMGGVGSTPIVTLFEFIPYDGSALLTAYGGNRAFYYATSTGVWVDITSPTTTNAVRNNFVDVAPMRTASSALRLITTQAYDDPPKWWTGSTATSFLYLTTAVMGACGITWRSHFLQGDTTDTGDGHVACRVHWSALGDPTVWTGTASAGSIDLLDQNCSAVRRFLPLQQQLVVYKEESAHVLTYKASPFYFTQRLLHPLIALLSPRAVCNVKGGDLHFVFTPDGAVLWDGQTIQTIGRNRVDRTIINQIYPAQNTLINAFWRPDTNEVYLSLHNTIGGATTRTWVYNLEFDSWWETDMDIFTATYVRKSFTSSDTRVVGSVYNSGNLTTGNTALVYRLFTGMSDTTSSSTISSSFQTGLYDYGTYAHKQVERVAVVAGPASGTQATLGVQIVGTENPCVPTLTFGSTQTITVTGGSEPEIVDLRLTDKWIGYRVTHAAAGETCEVHSLIPHVTPRSHVRKRRA